MGTIRKELAEAVIQDCHEMSLKDALDKHGVNVSNFFKTLNAVPLLDEAYARAQNSRAEMFMDQTIDIADDADIDPNRARNMIQVRQLYAAKIKPQKFGDRIDLNVNNVIDIRGALDQAITRSRPILDITPSLTAGDSSAISHGDTGPQPTSQAGDTAETVAEFKNELAKLLE